MAERDAGAPGVKNADTPSSVELCEDLEPVRQGYLEM